VTLSDRMPPPTGCRERAFDGYAKVLNRIEGAFREPFVEALIGLLAREDLVPDDLALARV
jgi:hypothetical protein